MGLPGRESSGIIATSSLRADQVPACYGRLGLDRHVRFWNRYYHPLDRQEGRLHRPGSLQLICRIY